MSLTGSASMTNELQGSVESGGEVRGKLSGLEFIQGKSAYEVAVINGFSGTEEEWLASLKGEPGRPGDKGEQGEPGSVVFEELTDEQKEMLRGYPGEDGQDGKDGADGYTPVKGKDYFDGEDGRDGVSPTVSVVAISGGHRVSITDANGTKTFDVMDGEDGAAGAGTGDMLAKVYDPQGKKQDIFAYVDEKTKDIDVDVTADEVTFADGETFQQKYDSGELTGPAGKDGQDGAAGQDGSPGADGQPGADGEDGYSPTVSVATITGGHRITITDKDGTKNVDVMDGSDGAAGQDGETGPAGADGAAGKDATINGVNALTLTTGTGLSGTQSGSTYTLSLASHNQAASTITAGTFAGQVVANSSGQTPGTKLIRNSKLMAATAFDAVTDWGTHITNGEIVWRYE